MTDEEWAAAPPMPRVAIIRHALKLSQDDFAAHFHIPVGTLRDWEQGRKEPDAAANGRGRCGVQFNGSGELLAQYLCLLY